MALTPSDRRKAIQSQRRKPEGPLGWMIEQEVECRGLTFASVATAIGVTHGAMSRWVSGDRNPSRHDVARLADFFEFDDAYRLVFFSAAGYSETILTWTEAEALVQLRRNREVSFEAVVDLFRRQGR